MKLNHATFSFPQKRATRKVQTLLARADPEKEKNREIKAVKNRQIKKVKNPLIRITSWRKLST